MCCVHVLCVCLTHCGCHQPHTHSLYPPKRPFNPNSYTQFIPFPVFEGACHKLSRMAESGRIAQADDDEDEGGNGMTRSNTRGETGGGTGGGDGGGDGGRGGGMGGGGGQGRPRDASNTTSNTSTSASMDTSMDTATDTAVDTSTGMSIGGSFLKLWPALRKSCDTARSRNLLFLQRNLLQGD